MITFTLALLLLIGGYWVYGAYVNRIFRPDDRKTPALTMTDGVDYIPLPTWKIFMIQFLNIAGLGPIFGAIMGAQFGTASYLWIVLGTIFAGAVHDFFSGALSIRNGGESLPEIVGRYLGTTTKKVMTVFTMILMILVGAVFVSGPAELIAGMTPGWMDAYFWIVVIFLYYVLATLLPVDKIIGKVYPLFAIALLFMAVGILVMLYVKNPELPEMWNGFGTKYDSNPIFPMMFISIACGAISGFHATQSPLMARCMTHEKHCGACLGCRSHLFLPGKRHRRPSYRTCFLRGDGCYPHLERMAGYLRRHSGFAWHCGGTDNQWRYSPPFGTPHYGRLPAHRPASYCQASAHLHTVVPAYYRCAGL